MVAYDVVNWEQCLSLWPQVAAVAFLIHLPLGLTGWWTLNGKRWAAWLGLVMTAFHVPPLVLAIVVEPMLFRELYLAHDPYFSFNSHFIVLICFVVQLFLFGCAVAYWLQKIERKRDGIFG